ncbi:enoyl-CoA hydratase/isomerase family protein [Thalassobius sp. MITS945101]|uniref:enoyl-CoA hydratase/isomerase family protein n=1 Tax=Thalassobius sp. MITS945101 TaxID=3096994 RepID=UPI003999A5E5
MTDIQTRIEGQIGRITLTRPKALNALSYEMCLEIEKAQDAWAADDAVKMVLLDAEGERAFCAGGDIAEMYAAGTKGDFAYGRTFWSDEYRMNAKLFNFPKPVASLMQGFTMGGGVGIGCHGSHRVVGESSQIAMPETGIGLIPDVGGTLILARAPGRIGEYLGATGGRIGAADAIHAGFADYFVPEEKWPALTAELIETGDWEAIDRAAQQAPAGVLADQQAEIDMLFAGDSLTDVLNALQGATSEFAAKALKTLNRVSPLSAGCTIELVHRARASDDIQKALEQEYRFTYRSMDMGDFLEGVRAQIIDKDRNPTWKHGSPGDVTSLEITQMLLPLGENALKI